MINKKIVVSGKRKTAVAKATIESGTGNVLFNKRPINFLNKLQQLEINEPLIIAKDILSGLNFDISLNVRGGGLSCQVEAGRLAIARAIIEFSHNKKIQNAFVLYDRNMLIADTRRKETCKPGDSKARANRQTSFR